MDDWLKQVLTQGPLVAVMAVAVLTLWRRMERKDAEYHRNLETLSERVRITAEKFAEKTAENQTKLHAILETLLARKQR